MTHTADSPIGPNVVDIDTWNPQVAAPDSDIDYVDIASVDRETKSIIGTTRIQAKEAPSRARQIVQAGDVLVSTVRPNLNAVALVPVQLTNAIASTGFCVLRCQPKKLDNRYLFHWVRTNLFVAAMVRQATGASYPAVSDRIIKDSKIPLPPLPEQKRIADILDKADAIRRKRRETIELTDRLIESAFFQLFGDTNTNEKKWTEVNLEDLCENVIDCPHSTPEYATNPTGYHCVRSSDIQNGRIDLSSTREVSRETFDERIARHRPTAGEVVFTREGGRLGNAAQIPPGLAICLGQRMMLFSCKPKVSTNEFLWALLNSHGVQHQVRLLTAGAAAPRINIADIRLFKAIKPPYQLQSEFTKIMDRIRGQHERYSQSLEESACLFNSLVQRAFRGELK